MSITDKPRDESEDWPAELRFHKMRCGRTRKSWQSGEVSPVPSFYSEPASVWKLRDVISSTRPLDRGAHQEEEEDEEDTQSLKSLPTVMNTLAFDPKVKRSHRVPRGHVLTDFSLPLLVTSRCTLAVRGTAYSRSRGFLPAIKPKREHKSVERPPCRAGCRPDNLCTAQNQCLRTVGRSLNTTACQSQLSGKMPGSCVHQPSPPCPLAPLITPQRVVVHAIHPVTPSIMEETKRTKGVHQSSRPAPEPKRGALQRLLDEGYLPLAGDPRLLDPISGFQEHLRRQLLNSPLPCGAPFSRVRPPSLPRPAVRPLGAGAPPEPRGPGGSRTVQLCNSRGKRLPRITMTCPTPSPKHLHHPHNRHVA